MSIDGADGKGCGGRMHFTVERAALVKLVERLSAPPGGQRRRVDPLRLWTAGANLCAEANGVVAGLEALVFRDGHCRTDRTRFLQLLKSYHPEKNLTFELTGNGLRFGSTTLEVAEAATAEAAAPHFAMIPTQGGPDPGTRRPA